MIAVLLAGGVALAFALLAAPEVPSQPINFSHKIHAGDNQIPCQYCHAGARRSPVAGVPSIERCMGCHRITAADKPEIAKLKSYYDKGETIPWTRIFWLPDFTYFDHRPHIQKGIACQTCHGQVQTMDRFPEQPTLEMGWCLKCHREKGAAVDCYVCHR